MARTPLPVLVAVLVSLAACGSSTTTPAGDAGAPTASAPATTGAPASGDAPCGLTADYIAVAPGDGAPDRRVNLTVPDGPGPFPAVISLHGVSGTKDHQDAATGLPAFGREEGFVTLTPETAPGETAWSLEPAGPDGAYLLDLAERLAADPCVDPERVFVAGFSNGAMMAVLLSCLSPDTFAAVGAVAGLVALDPCRSGPALPLVAVHGTADPSIGYDGVISPTVVDLVGYETGPDVPSLARSWSARQGCTAPPTETAVGADRRLDFCDDVTLMAVEGGDHVWPGPNAGTALDANEVLWAFFDAH